MPATIAAKATMSALCADPALRVVRCNVLALGPSSGCLVVVWGDEQAEPGHGPLSSVPDIEGAGAAKGTCPKCHGTQVLGAADGDGDLVCARCSHAWHDANSVDD